MSYSSTVNWAALLNTFSRGLILNFHPIRANYLSSFLTCLYIQLSEYQTIWFSNYFHKYVFKLANLTINRNTYVLGRSIFKMEVRPLEGLT